MKGGRALGRSVFLQMAEGGTTMPLATDLVLHEEPDVGQVLSDGRALGRLVVRAARRFEVPLALPRMDLTLEKDLLLQGVAAGPRAVEAFHFRDHPGEAALVEGLVANLAGPLPPRLQAQVDAVRFVATSVPDLIPCGLTIGPFSLMTTLLEDPISAVYLAYPGSPATDPAMAGLVDAVLDLSMRTVERSLREQLEAGAKVVVACEPAVNRVYVSPRQVQSSPEGFDRLVMANLRRYKAILDDYGAEPTMNCGTHASTKPQGASRVRTPAVGLTAAPPGPPSGPG